MEDMENLIMFNTNVGEAPKTLQLVNSEIKGMKGHEVSSFYSSGGHSDNTSWRSSKSASVDSSSNKEIKQTCFSFDSNECFQEDLVRTKETVESSGESLTALELCNRTYFDDVSGFNNVNKNTAQPSVTLDFSAKKLKSCSLSSETPHCQVEGCNVNLSAAKSYHRKHRVCESHSKCSMVVVSGCERRWCQQCSRFHSLSEFDQKKRSCRNRLSNHNARRRKPKPEVIQFKSMRLASSLFEGRNQLNSGSNQVPAHSNTWDNNTRDFTVTLPKTDVFTNKVYQVSDHFLPPHGAPHGGYPRGIPTSVAPSNMESTQNQGALSLLSIGSWGSCDPAGPSPHIHGALPHGGFSTSSDFWGAAPGVGSHVDKPSFQLFKAPDESGFYLY